VGTTAADLGTWPKTVRRWRAKHLAGWRGRCGDDRAGSGRRRRVDAEMVEAVVAGTLDAVPEDGPTRWSTRAVAARHGVGKDVVAGGVAGPGASSQRWCTEVTDKRNRRGSSRSVDELVAAVDHWSEHGNDDPKPFVWHRAAEEVIAKVRRGRAALDQVTKSATHHYASRRDISSAATVTKATR
jgi:hypothetical protein